jgi:hypothetical protein
MEVIVFITFAQKKNLFLTSYTQRKVTLWKSCGLSFKSQLSMLIIMVVIVKCDSNRADND